MPATLPEAPTKSNFLSTKAGIRSGQFTRARRRKTLAQLAGGK